MFKSLSLALLGTIFMVGGGCTQLGLKADASYHPKIDSANFQATVDNPYFPLVPGTTWKHIETDKGETTETIMTVTHDTKTVMGVKCVVVHDVAMKKGRVAEDTYDWFAQDKQGTVWYFGEQTKEISVGGRISTLGSWEAGVNGALPGIIMPADPSPGEPYRQEYAMGEAEDMGQVSALNETVTVPAGKYIGCVRTKDWSMLEAGSEKKWYAKGVGLVRTESTGGEVSEMISMTKE